MGEGVLRRICEDPVRTVVVQQTQVKKGLFKKVTVEVAAIGDENGKPLGGFVYVPESIGEYGANGLTTAETIRVPGRKVYVDLQGEVFLGAYDLTFRDDCIELQDWRGLKGIASLNGKVWVLPREELQGFQAPIDNNSLERTGNTYIIGWVEQNPKVGGYTNSQLGAGVIENGVYRNILPRSYNFITGLEDGLLAVGRCMAGETTTYKLLSKEVKIGYIPVFMLCDAATGKTVSPLAFTCIDRAEGGYRAVVIPGVRFFELEGKGWGWQPEHLADAYIVTLNDRFEEISEHEPTRTLLLE